MLKVQFTLLDSNNFYQQGLLYVLQDYIDFLNECYQYSPQSAPVEFNSLDNMEIIFRTQEDNQGCASCYISAHHTPQHQQMTMMILENQEHYHSTKHSLSFSIHRDDSTSQVRQKLQLALEHFCHQPLAVRISSLYKCHRCRLAALSACEKKVLKLMSTGMSATTIADMLQRSQKTISAHKRSAMRKLNVNKNSELNRVLLGQLGLG
ncbi:LuxR family transcriptional regulator [Chania multitudinisentens RB-25]|uniref:LuxR family transcriptional regulator n=2 Tax=Chania TaxID=1745211 RepID=W0L8I4_9GAMM|nr:LuxR family transcriptional regulator [Chania multitudinisentens RB-25]